MSGRERLAAATTGSPCSPSRSTTRARRSWRVGLEALRATDGVLDVVQLPAFGKKGRLARQVQVLARPERLDAVIERVFR